MSPISDALDRMQKRAETAEARVTVLTAALRDIRDNYDHDADAHRYGTPCRVCTAERAIGVREEV